MKPYFTVNGLVNKDTLYILKKYLYSPTFTLFINIIIFISGTLALLFFLLKSALLMNVF